MVGHAPASCLIGDGLDFYLAPDHIPGLQSRARWLVERKEFAVDAIEFSEVMGVFEPDGHLDNILERATRQREHLCDVLQGLAGMRLDPRDDVPVSVPGDRRTRTQSRLPSSPVSAASHT